LVVVVEAVVVLVVVSMVVDLAVVELAVLLFKKIYQYVDQQVIL
jgi:hypothetical protein